MMFNKNNIELNREIKSQNAKKAFLLLFKIDANNEQIMRCFELVDNQDLFEVFDSILRENLEIPDKYLALNSIYFNAKYFWDIKHKSGDEEKYALLKKTYIEKEKNVDYQRVVFNEWKRLFNEMIDDKTIYKSEKNKSSFYHWPHTYEEYIIENGANNLKFMFNSASKKEILELIINCPNYPKIPQKNNKKEYDYNAQNSRYYDVQYLGRWLNNEVLSKLIKDNQVENLDVMDMPLISKGVIKEIKLFYVEIKQHIDLLEPEHQVLFKKLYEVRLKELVDEYHSIYNKKTTKIKNGKEYNADELLYDSLIEIRNIMDNYSNKIIEKQLENLSIGIRATSGFIKNSL